MSVDSGTATLLLASCISHAHAGITSPCHCRRETLTTGNGQTAVFYIWSFCYHGSDGCQTIVFPSIC